MIKKYYYFPFKKNPPFILYENHSCFNKKLFQNLYYKISSNSFKLRLRKDKVVSKIFELFFHKNIVVPNRKIDIIYFGFDNTIFFDKNRDFIYLKNEGKFEKKDFLGYNLNFANIDEIESQKGIIVCLLKEHLKNLLESNVTLHGDFTPFNILTSGNNYSFIDQKRVNSDSKLFDHFYFYIYTKKRILGYLGLKKSLKEEIISELDDIFVNVFKNLDEKFILSELNKIRFEKYQRKDFDFENELDEFKELVIHDS